jgi:L-serine dehydratase
MQSLRELYKVGPGPSSSHTLAPYRSLLLFIKRYGILDHYKVELFGSLSLTGKGHGTKEVFVNTLKPARVEVEFKLNWEESFPNGFYITGYDHDDIQICHWTVFSIGGGSIEIKEFQLDYNDEAYFENNLEEIKQVLKQKEIDLLEYIYSYEPDLKEYLLTMEDAIFASVEKGLVTEGLLNGPLNVKRSAKELYELAKNTEDENEKNKIRIMSYSYAVSEENACGKQVVTTPTLGACGVLAAISYHFYKDKNFSKEKIADGLAIAGLFGNIVKRNATISGAVGGCQAEIGTACSMAAAFASFMMNRDLKEMEYSAEIAMEHNLGLTCDPVGGYVIIPCIERNAMAAMRALDSACLAKTMSLIKINKVSFDEVVRTMEFTGKNMAFELRETSLGGLAKEVNVEQ